MQRIHIDIAGKFLDNYFLVIVDSFSKWPEIYIMQNISSATVVEKLTDFFSRFGNPSEIVSDNGTQFTSPLFESFCQERGIKHLTCPTYHLQSNGQAERFVDTLKRSLKKMGTTYQKLQTFLQCYRSTPNVIVPGNRSPAEVFIGRRLTTEVVKPRPLVKPRPVSYNRNEKMEQQFNRQHGARQRIPTINNSSSTPTVRTQSNNNGTVNHQRLSRPRRSIRPPARFTDYIMNPVQQMGEMLDEVKLYIALVD